jgi:hypothetical protein
MAEEPCCEAEAARRVRQLTINGRRTGIDHLDDIMEEVLQSGIDDESRIGEMLLGKVREHNYVPEKVIPAYRDALMAEYRRRSLKIASDLPIVAARCHCEGDGE